METRDGTIRTVPFLVAWNGAVPKGPFAKLFDTEYESTSFLKKWLQYRGAYCRGNETVAELTVKDMIISGDVPCLGGFAFEPSEASSQFIRSYLQWFGINIEGDSDTQAREKVVHVLRNVQKQANSPVGLSLKNVIEAKRLAMEAIDCLADAVDLLGSNPATKIKSINETTESANLSEWHIRNAIAYKTGGEKPFSFTFNGWRVKNPKDIHEFNKSPPVHWEAPPYPLFTGDVSLIQLLLSTLSSSPPALAREMKQIITSKKCDDSLCKQKYWTMFFDKKKFDN
jgi:hypothetical protein